MWGTQDDPLIIDPGNDYYIVKLLNRAKYVRALSEGPRMIGDNYLHVQRWRHNFVADSAKISSLPMWLRFPWLPVEYYTVQWLYKAGDMIGRTIKIDDITLAMARGRFARVSMGIELEKPVKASFQMRGRE